jgi:hypothetical protein
MDCLMRKVVIEPSKYQLLMSDITVPPPLCSHFARPDKEAVNAVVSRFRKSET